MVEVKLALEEVKWGVLEAEEHEVGGAGGAGVEHASIFLRVRNHDDLTHIDDLSILP